MVEHVSITDPNIHETKGASTAAAGQVLTGTGLGTAVFQNLPAFSTVQVGNYRIVNSASPAVALTAAGTFYTITNDKLGAGTSSIYGVSGVTNVFDATNNQFILSGFAIGDLLMVSAEVDVTVGTANTAVDVVLDLGVGDPGTYTIPLLALTNIKTASTVRLVCQKWVAIRDNITLVNPARIRARADTTGATVLAKSFDLGVLKRV